MGLTFVDVKLADVNMVGPYTGVVRNREMIERIGGETHRNVPMSTADGQWE